MTTFFIYKSIKLIMKTNIKIILFSICTILLTFTSCKKEPGCMDPNSMTYNSEAKKDDGSCIYAYDIAQGLWNITPDCQALTITILTQSFEVPLNDIFPETINITGEGVGVVSMDMNGENVLADVAYDGIVTIQDGQKISFNTSSFDPTGLIGEVDVDITGSGTIVSDSNGNLSLTLSFEILGTPQSSTCEITFSK